jgi:hypothetical protein
VYETRPTFFGLRLLSFWIPLPVVALLILVVIDAAFLPDPAFGVAATGIFTFLFAIPMLYAVNYWRTTAYALTDQRVIVSEGNSFQSATYDRVTDVTMGKGSSRLVFSLVPDTPPGTPSGPGGPKGPHPPVEGGPGSARGRFLRQERAPVLSTPPAAAAPPPEPGRLLLGGPGRLRVLCGPHLGQHVATGKPALSTLRRPHHGRSVRNVTAGGDSGELPAGRSRRWLPTPGSALGGRSNAPKERK